MMKQGLMLAVFIVIAFMAPALSALLSVSGPGEWYAGLNKPWFNPPSWIFGPVWTVLYTLMGVAAWLVWRQGAGNLYVPLGLFGVQLVLNATWTPLFFGFQRPDLALMNIAVLWIAIAATGFAFYPLTRAGALLLLPYWLWVSFAMILNASLWWLNRGA